MKLNVFAMMIAVAGFMVLPSVKADEVNKETTITLNTSVAVPGQVLAPGRYVFKRLDNQSDRNIVRIFNEDQTHVIATVLTAPAYRTEPTDETVITLEERPNGDPEAMGKWFYPGDTDGVEFLYLGGQR